MTAELTDEKNKTASSPEKSLDKNVRKKRIFTTIFLITIGVISLSSGMTKFSEEQSNKLYSNNVENRTFRIDSMNDIFLKDGVEFQFLSGSIHYFRIPRIYWYDRIVKAKALGLDAIQIDIPWNFHERVRGQYTFQDSADVEKFIFLAEQNGLLVITRIGPFIGSDWSLGGMPPWLLHAHPNIRMRTSDADFLNAVQDWFAVLLPKLKPHLYHNGGPIIMIQIENEYGSYAACDNDYIGALNAIVKHHLGSAVIISTADVSSKRSLKCGSPYSSNLATISFGPFKGDADDNFVELFDFQPDSPWVNSEFYTGWMDHWGFAHFYAPPKVYIHQLLELLTYSPRLNVNIYMFHGGTNFGFWSGAVGSPYSSQVTSYDYNAPLSEAGDVTDFYHQLREAITSFKNISKMELPKNVSKTVYPSVQMFLVSHMLAQATNGINAMLPMNMETTQQYQGFMLYRTQFYRNVGDIVKLKFKDLADYAYVYTASVSMDSIVLHGAVSRNDKSLVFRFKPKFNTTDLLILIENAGYITYSSKGYNDFKGILGPVSADGRELLGWTMLPVCLTKDTHSACNTTIGSRIVEKLSEIEKSMSNVEEKKASWPISGSIFAGSLNISTGAELADTFVQPLNFTRGVLIVNDDIVGRYNQALGPQLRLYLPKTFLRHGLNTFILIELDSLWINETMVGGKQLEGVNFPILFDFKMHWQMQRKRPIQ